MARRSKGVPGITDEKPKVVKKAIPDWVPPKADDVHEGMTLVHISIDGKFPMRVTSLQHEGTWVFGRAPDGSGPYAVPLRECMTLTQAAMVLHAEQAADAAETS
jgi:hypothetical protein